MTLNLRNSANVPQEWLIDDDNGAGFSGADQHRGSTHLNAAVGTSNAISSDEFTARQTGSVNCTQESFLDTPIFNEFTGNEYLFNDAEMYFPGIPVDDGVFSSEYVRLLS